MEVSQVHVNSLTPIRPELGQHPITRLPHVHVNPAIDFVLTGKEVKRWAGNNTLSMLCFSFTTDITDIVLALYTHTLDLK